MCVWIEKLGEWYRFQTWKGLKKRADLQSRKMESSVLAGLCLKYLADIKAEMSRYQDESGVAGRREV